jgi:hypothetical protein
MKKDENNLFPKLDFWFKDMDAAFKKIKDSHEKSKKESIDIDQRLRDSCRITSKECSNYEAPADYKRFRD